MKLPTRILPLIALVLGACSPYAEQMKRLDADYRAGRIPTRDYYALRSRMMDGDNQWRSNVAASLNASAASINQTTANINDQNAINAYNARTRVYAQPQQVNVNHSGYINHNVNGRVNVYGY